jgi:hypothetical protein
MRPEGGSERELTGIAEPIETSSRNVQEMRKLQKVPESLPLSTPAL